MFSPRAGSLGESRQEGWRERRDPPALLPYVLAGFVLLYALQVLYSPDFSKGLQNVCFFFVPFSLVYGLLRDVSWDRKLLTLVLCVVGVEAVCFVLIGTVEHFTRELLWNDQVIRSNEFHTYFRVNSVFWDPNIYGRYLSLVAVVAMSALLWARERRTLALLTALVAVLWIGLVPTFSQSSFAALLAGLAVLAALKWSLRWTLVAVGTFVVLGVLVVLLTGGQSQLQPHQHRHVGPRQPSLRRHPPIRPKAFVRLRLGKLPQGLPRARRDAQSSSLGLAHRANDDRCRAGPPRRSRLHSSRRNSPVDDDRKLASLAVPAIGYSRGWRRRGDRPRGSFSYRRGRWVPCGDRTRAPTTNSPCSDPRNLHSPDRPHDGLCGFFRGPDYLGAPCVRRIAGGRRST